MRRVASITAIIVGLALSVGLLAGGGLSGAFTGERLLDGARPSASGEGSAQLRADTDLVKAGIAQIVGEELPAHRDALGLNEQQFDVFLADCCPGVATNIAILGEGSDALDKTVANLERIAPDFDEADALPVGFLPLPVAALAFAAMTAALLVCGIAALRTASRWPLVAIAALSVVVLAGLVGSRTIQKAAATERTFDKVSITTEVTDRMTRQLDGVTGFLAAHRDELVPATAAELGVAPQNMADQLDAAFPAAAALRSAPGSAALDHIGDSVAFRRGNVSNYETVKALPVSALMWASTGLWTLVAATSLLAIAFHRSTRDETPHQRTGSQTSTV